MWSHCEVNEKNSSNRFLPDFYVMYLYRTWSSYYSDKEPDIDTDSSSFNNCSQGIESGKETKAVSPQEIVNYLPMLFQHWRRNF